MRPLEHQAQAEAMAPVDLIACLIPDELTRRGARLLERRHKQTRFRDPQANLDNFDFDFDVNKRMLDWSLIWLRGTSSSVLKCGPCSWRTKDLYGAIGAIRIVFVLTVRIERVDNMYTIC